jgi:aspartate kinase
VERAVVRGIRTSEVLAEIAVRDTPEAAARVFRTVADAGVHVGATAYYSVPGTGRANMSFTVAARHGRAVVELLRDHGFDRVRWTAAIRVTLVGAGMRTDPVVPALFGEALARAGVHMNLVSVEGARVSAVCPVARHAGVVRALREVFEVGVLSSARSVEVP